jgi:tetratricopeptide (TPR) repeat protein
VVRVVIPTPDQRLRVFVSSTLGELAEERRAVAEAISLLRLTVVMFDLGARSHPPQQVYRDYLAQSDVFIGLYWQRYGWVGPGMDVSGLEEEFELSASRPRLLYVKTPAPDRDARLDRLIARVEADARVSYKTFMSAGELGKLVADDLAALLSERFPGVTGNEVLATPSVVQAWYSLPPDTAAFTGRAREVDLITAAAAQGGNVMPVLAIAGLPGVGKTALAVHAAHLLRDRFLDRQLFVDLHAHTPGRDPVPPETALAGLLSAVGVDGSDLPDDIERRADLWRDRMAGQRVLLVLDNATSSSQVVPLLPGGSGCLVLVTSRRHLGDLPGTVVPVPLDVLPPAQAQVMFARLARRSAGDAGATASELIRMAGYLPLAISLLARVYARHPAWTLANLASETRRRLLTLSAENDSVAAAFEVSYRYLPPGRQRFFRLLGLHPGTTIDPYAAAALTGAPLDEARRELDALQGESLLTETGYLRYAMHDLIRQFARDLAAAAPAAENEERVGSLLDYYQHAALAADAGLARQARTRPSPTSLSTWPQMPDRPGRNQALAWARAERANLLACLDQVTSAGQPARVVALTAGIAALLRLDGSRADAINRHATAVQAARNLGDRLGQANALADLGDVLRLTGNYAGATHAGQEALAVYRAIGDRTGQANARSHLGIVLSLTDDYPAAAEALQEALGMYHDLGSKEGQADVLTRLGDVLRLTGNYQDAGRSQEEALAIYRSLGDRTGEAYALNHLGVVRRRTGDYQAAVRAQEQALAVYRDLGNRQGQANALCYLGTVLQQTGDLPGATRAHEEALAIYRDLGNRLGEANVIGELGIVWRCRGQYPAAASAQEEALSLYSRLGDRLSQAITRYELAIVRRLTGDYPGAAESLHEALSAIRELGDPGAEAEVLNELGTLHRVRGHLDQARASHQNALRLAREVHSTWDEANALAGLGRCALAAGHNTDAEGRLRQALEIFQRIGTAESAEVTAELDALTRTAHGATGQC